MVFTPRPARLSLKFYDTPLQSWRGCYFFGLLPEYPLKAAGCLSRDGGDGACVERADRQIGGFAHVLATMVEGRVSRAPRERDHSRRHSQPTPE
jgi:hypothetical protein